MEVKEFFIKNYLIIGIATVFVLGLLFPHPGLALNRLRAGPVTIPQVSCGVMFIASGLLLDSIAEAIQPKATAVGLGLILAVTPAVAWPMMRVGDGLINLPLLQGLAIFALVPTTLSASVTYVTYAKGNTSLAILLTTASNIICVFLLPFYVSKLFETEVELPIGQIMIKLIMFTLLPLIIGLSLRKGLALVAEFVAKNRRVLTLAQHCCVITVIWLMISTAQPQIVQTPLLDVFVCFVLGFLLHVVFLLLCSAIASLFSLPPREWVCVVILGSQKTLPMCVAVLSSLPEDNFQFGELLMPIVFAHFTQLLVDSFLSKRWEIEEEATPSDKFSTIFGERSGDPPAHGQRV